MLPARQAPGPRLPVREPRSGPLLEVQEDPVCPGLSQLRVVRTTLLCLCHLVCLDMLGTPREVITVLATSGGSHGR